MRRRGTPDQAKKKAEQTKASLETGPATGIAGLPGTMATSKTKKRDTRSTTSGKQMTVAAVKGGQAHRGRGVTGIAIDHPSAAAPRMIRHATQAHVGRNYVRTAI
jgi:hypothetical protein